MIRRPESCLGYTLQTGTKLVSIFQMAFAISLIGLSIKRIATEDGFDSWVSVSIFIILQVLLGIFSFLLFEGSKDRNLQSCKTWITATSVLTVALGVYIIFELYDNPSLKIYSAHILLSIITIFSNIGFIWITDGFAYQLQDEEGEGGTVYND